VGLAGTDKLGLLQDEKHQLYTFGVEELLSPTRCGQKRAQTVHNVLHELLLLSVLGLCLTVLLGA
jgi:hypothetical protein